MVTLHEVITFLVSMQISISSLQTHNVNRCGRSRHLARKLSLRRKQIGRASCRERVQISGGAGSLKKKSYVCLRANKRLEWWREWQWDGRLHVVQVAGK